MIQTKPLARQSGLVIRELADEVLIYDLERDKAFCLNRTAALVWKHCNGKISPPEMARVLRKETGESVDERVVWYALDQLGRDRLLEQRLDSPDSLAGMTRREQLRSLAKVAAAIPLVTAVVAPRAAQAATCVRPCQTNSDCPPGPPSCVDNCCIPVP